MDCPEVVDTRSTGGVDRKLSTSRTPAGEFRFTVAAGLVPMLVVSAQVEYGAGSCGVPYPPPGGPAQVRVTCPSPPAPPAFPAPRPAPPPPPGPVTGAAPGVGVEVKYAAARVPLVTPRENVPEKARVPVAVRTCRPVRRAP